MKQNSLTPTRNPGVRLIIGMVAAAMILTRLTLSAQEVPAASEPPRADRKDFQNLELITARYGGWLFLPGMPPKLVWRDAATAERFGMTPGFTTRWFNAQLQESPTPNAPGRWLAYLEGRSPNGFPWRRSFTFFGVPTNVTAGKPLVPDLTIQLPNFPGADAPQAWREHEEEFARASRDFLLKGLVDLEQGAIMIAGLAESPELGRSKKFSEWTSARNSQIHLDLKLKLFGRDDQIRALDPWRKRAVAAPILHEVRADEQASFAAAADAIDSFCSEWVAATSESFVTLVAKDSQIILHKAYGTGPDGTPVDRDYRCWVASITKTVTALMFSQFVDQGRIQLDWTLDRVFPDYPSDTSHVPTFRQLLNHTSGLSGHAEWGGMLNPHFENIVLAEIDLNQPGVKQEYAGIGFELAAKAMEYVTGKCAPRIFEDHLFAPLHFGNVVFRNASSDGEFTAYELAILGQILVNGGSYGEFEMVSPATLQQFLPGRAENAPATNDQGLGIHRVHHLRPDAPEKSQRAEDQLFSDQACGHGSLSGCILFVDPVHRIVVTQVRKQFRDADQPYWQRFFAVISANLTVPDR